MIVGLMDYGVGNLHSLAKAIERGGAEVRIETNPHLALATDALVLPGVGAFGPAAQAVTGARDQIRDALREGFPCLGICLGMQILFEDSEESPGMGLGVIPGRVHKLAARRIPHMGWNAVAATHDPLFRGVEHMMGYYANSYVATPLEPEDVIATTEYEGHAFPAAVRRARTWGVQFHPEKSAEAGLTLVTNFLREAAR
jgi:glutamine amidotransferase